METTDSRHMHIYQLELSFRGGPSPAVVLSIAQTNKKNAYQTQKHKDFENHHKQTRNEGKSPFCQTYGVPPALARSIEAMPLERQKARKRSSRLRKLMTSTPTKAMTNEARQLERKTT
mgnify:FL=1